MRNEVTATPLGVYFSSGSVASRPIRITDPDNSFKTLAYGAADPASVPGGFLQTTATDELNRNTVDAYQRTVLQTAYKGSTALDRTLDYDQFGRLTSLSDPADNTPEDGAIDEPAYKAFVHALHQDPTFTDFQMLLPVERV